MLLSFIPVQGQLDSKVLSNLVTLIYKQHYFVPARPRHSFHSNARKVTVGAKSLHQSRCRPIRCVCVRQDTCGEHSSCEFCAQTRAMLRMLCYTQKATEAWHRQGRQKQLRTTQTPHAVTDKRNFKLVACKRSYACTAAIHQPSHAYTVR